MYDNFVALPKNEKEWKAELTLFLEDWEFPCVGAWDGFHVYVNCHLKNFFSFKKRYSVTNMGLMAANKRFLWAGVGAPESMHDSIILQSSDIFNSIQEGQVLLWHADCSNIQSNKFIVNSINFLLNSFYNLFNSTKI